jgi:hypothetical protein
MNIGDGVTHVRKLHHFTEFWRRMIWGMVGIAILLALAHNLYPVPERPYGKLAFVHLADLTLGMLWFLLTGRNAARAAR